MESRWWTFLGLFCFFFGNLNEMKYSTVMRVKVKDLSSIYRGRGQGGRRMEEENGGGLR